MNKALYILIYYTMNEEKWKEFKKGYLVSNFGNVKSVERFEIFNNFLGTNISRFHEGKILKKLDNGHGYISVQMGRRNRKYVHRLVAITFKLKGRSSSKKYINHKNGIKNDNNLENLEWVTSSENQIHSLKTGLRRSGENHPNSKISDNHVRYIRDNYNQFDKDFCGKSLAKKFSISRTTISCIVNGKRRKLF